MSDREEELKKASRLESIGRNLTHLAFEGRIGPIYERKEIISELASQLCIGENNILLVGEPGTGKNAVVEGLACWIARNEVDLPYKVIVECTHVSFQAFCMYVHEFETKLQMIVEELRKHKAILFFDQINLAVGAGAVSGFEERTLANLLNPYIARNEIRIIGATTRDGYKAILRGNPSFASKFIRLDIPVITADQALTILNDLKAEIEDKYQVKIEDDALSIIIDMSDRFHRERFFPGKAFEVLRDIIATESHGTEREGSGWIRKEHVYSTFKRRTGLPDFVIYRDRYIKKEDVRDYFDSRIFGQDEAVEEVVNTVLNLKAELNDPQKPVAVFLFAGPTGVGKTYLARLLADYLFGSEEKLFRYDMSEYSTSDSVERLINGRREEKRGKLVEDILASPFSVILFDEIEKAHPNIFNLLLSLIGEGRLTDEKGRTVNFCNTIILMTSNIGGELYSRIPIGLRTDDEVSVTEKDLFKKIKEYFRPEFINRLTKVIPFKPLSREQIRVIAKKEVDKLVERKGITHRELKIGVSEKVIDFLIEMGYNAEFGARPMQRAVERYIGFPLAEAISMGEVHQNEKIHMDLDVDRKISIRKG
jgi:ATP-dependent Clp protease ATP-binding subunit ClpC